jgi:L-ascorbate metabolism protein UlaG (beta-lactamase superfamily)
MEFQLIRHATLLLTYKGKKLLIDPMLSPSGIMDPVPLVPNQGRNPLVDLPIPLSSLLKGDAVLLTHSHRDHFDEEAAHQLPKDIPFFCQPADVSIIQNKGFHHCTGIDDSIHWEGIEIQRTAGQHGTGGIGEKMGTVSGYVLKSPEEKTVYIAGDTIWCNEVETAIEENQPHMIICNAGAPRFATGDPITMDEKDIEKVCLAAPGAKIIPVHMEAWNHCRLTRKELKNYLAEKGLEHQVLIPEDGQKISL